MTQDLKPDPSVIGGVADAPFVILPDRIGIFETRARRFAFLAESSNLADYLRFLAKVSRLQAQLATEAEPCAGATGIDRVSLATDPALHALMVRFCDLAKQVEMPAPAQQALTAVSAAGAEDRAWLFGNLAADTIPQGAEAPHLWAAAVWQVQATVTAVGLNAADLKSRGTGVCPGCGGKPVSSSVVGTGPVKNLRYCTCATCATRWNEVRIKCLCCGSTGGISYRSVETDEAAVKAECCDECKSWVKILYQSKNRSLEPVADDVGSLGLDMLMQDSGYTRGGFHPFLAGF